MHFLKASDSHLPAARTCASDFPSLASLKAAPILNECPLNEVELTPQKHGFKAVVKFPAEVQSVNEISLLMVLARASSRANWRQDAGETIRRDIRPVHPKRL